MDNDFGILVIAFISAVSSAAITYFLYKITGKARPVNKDRTSGTDITVDF